MGGPGGGLNPEQLFAAGYAACFHSALRGIARSQKLDLVDDSVTSEVGIGSNGAGGYGLAVTLRVELPGLEQPQADALVEAAHQVCPYSNATRGNVDVQLVVTVG
jgi:Ohr subfamily peroxiredoxin